MKQTIGLSQFTDEFQAIRPDNFTYEGLQVLFDYLEEVDPDLELDVIAICCDFSEMTPEEIAQAYGLDEDEDVLEFLSMETSVIGETDTTIVFIQF